MEAMINWDFGDHFVCCSLVERPPPPRSNHTTTFGLFSVSRFCGIPPVRDGTVRDTMLPANYLRRVAGCGGGVIGGRALSSSFPGRRVVSVTHGHSHISSSHKSHHGCHNIGQQRRMIQSLLARHKCVTVGLGSLELSSSMSTAELKVSSYDYASPMVQGQQG